MFLSCLYRSRDDALLFYTTVPQKMMALKQHGVRMSQSVAQQSLVLNTLYAESPVL